MKSKKPILVMAVLFFWIGYSVLSLSFYSLSITAMNEDHTQNKKNNIDYHLDSSIDNLVNNSTESLIDNLEAARNLDHFNFFLLRKDGQNLAFGANQGYLEGIDIPFPNVNQWVEDKNKTHIWKTKKINNYELTIGAVTSDTDFLLYKLNQKKYFLLAELAFVSLFSLGLIAFLLKDILKITTRLRSKDTNLNDLSTLSSEAQSILNAAKTMHETGVELRSTNETYSQIITPAIFEEVRLQTTAPSVFKTTLVRVDLNGYTRIFLEKREKYITEILNHYFTKAREVIERYDGLIYQYVGDEIVFHIKDTPQINSNLKAIFCIRHLFETAEEVEIQYARSQGHDFKIKCSLAYGALHFVRLDQGFAFSGLPLIESVRMLGLVNEKNENTLCMYDEDAKVYGKYFNIDETKDSLFKGFSNRSDVAMIRKFTKLNEVLGKSPVGELVSLYKSENDISFWLEHLKLSIEQDQSEYFFKVFGELKELKFAQGSEKIINSYIHLLNWTLLEYEKNDSKKVFLSALASLAFNLIPVASFNNDHYKLFEKIISVNDPRTKANALTTLSEFDPNSKIYKGYFKDDSNRLAGNALLIEAKKDFNSKTYDLILSFLKSVNPYFIATGLYVVEQTFKHYQSANTVFFKSFPLFANLLEECRPYLESENEMIRIRAKKVPGLDDGGSSHEFKIVS